jgi:F-type H+-transporting ATPase subunit a
VGVKENGLGKYLLHFAGPKLPIFIAIIITPLIFSIELISNLIRPFTLGIRLFANMFADEQISSQVANLYAPYTQLLLPIVLMPLGVFVAFVQTLVFTLLSMIYIGEVSHPPHDNHDYVHETHEPDAAVAHA